jgi:hypothetical protein
MKHALRYVCNVFTIAMAPDGGRLEYRQVTVDEARSLLQETEINQAVGHEQTVTMANAQIGADLLQFNRVSVRLEDGDDLVLCQYVGPRLPEGATTLPEGAEIRWYHATYTR